MTTATENPKKAYADIAAETAEKEGSTKNIDESLERTFARMTDEDLATAAQKATEKGWENNLVIIKKEIARREKESKEMAVAA